MSSDSEMNMEEAAKLLAGLPSDGKPLGTIDIKGSLTVTCACGNIIHTLTPDFFKFLNDGVLTFQNNVCPGCKEGEKADREMARFVCVRCRKAWFRIPPNKDKTGFLFSAGKSYHTDGCPFCRADGKDNKVKILEKVIHNRKLGLK